MPDETLSNLFKKVIADPTVHPLTAIELAQASRAKTLAKKMVHVHNFDRAMPNTAIHQGYAAEALETLVE